MCSQQRLLPAGLSQLPHLLQQPHGHDAHQHAQPQVRQRRYRHQRRRGGQGRDEVRVHGLAPLRQARDVRQYGRGAVPSPRCRRDSRRDRPRRLPGLLPSGREGHQNRPASGPQRPAGNLPDVVSRRALPVFLQRPADVGKTRCGPGELPGHQIRPGSRGVRHRARPMGRARNGAPGPGDRPERSAAANQSRRALAAVLHV